ncbi:MAG: 4-hydroxythreonine-4-phosphate dehydrogenase PdxA [Bacteroidota bacterium]
MSKIRIGISLGDTNGIGPEIVVKAFEGGKFGEETVPIVYGELPLLERLSKGRNHAILLLKITAPEDARAGFLNVIECWPEPVEYEPGIPTLASGMAAAVSLEYAVEDLRTGRIDALVTAPINKANMPRDRFPYPGHTEMLTDRLGADQSLMLLVNEGLRVGLVSNHLPVAQVAGAVTRETILRKLAIMHASLRQDFGCAEPRIAVFGLNPHAGDNGLLGHEEQTIIEPTLKEAQRRGINATGPYPADGFFGTGAQRNFDAILAMYHDQGLVPFKALSFGNGVNFTAGIPAIRTSPDHGTAFDIAGQDKADAASFVQAVRVAVEAVKRRGAVSSYGLVSEGRTL